MVQLTKSQAIKEHLEVLNLAVEKHSKLTISKYSQIICDIFLGIFDLRRLQLDSRTEDSYTEEEIDQIEEITNQIAIKVIFKLNDTTFRPIFNRLLEWATIPQTPKEKKGIMHRRITWCNFLFVFFDTLKVCLKLPALLLCVKYVQLTVGNYYSR